MNFVRVFGVDYYVVTSLMPAFDQYQMTLITGKWGNDLDATAPACWRLKAYLILSRYGALNAA